jgi:hypothetical protein
MSPARSPAEPAAEGLENVFHFLKGKRWVLLLSF